MFFVKTEAGEYVSPSIMEDEEAISHLHELMPLHVVPMDDVAEHVLEGTTCWCKPSYGEYLGETFECIVVHNRLKDEVQ